MNTHRQSPDTISNKKGNADTATQATPAWRNKHYASNWERVKDAFRRNFEGRDEIPEPHSAREVGQSGNDRDFAEREGRYGFAARDQYPHFTDWNPELESILRTDWDRMKTGRSFDDSRSGIRRGWDFSGQQRH